MSAVANALIPATVRPEIPEIAVAIKFSKHLEIPSHGFASA
jgi:hypothetical protein